MTAISNLGLEEVGEYTAIDRYRQVLKGRSGTARDTLRRYDPNDKTIEWTPGLKYKIKDKIDALLVIRNLYLLSISHDVNPSFPFVHTIHDIENDRDNFKITPNELRAVKDEPLRGSRTIPFDIRFNPSTDILTIPPDRFNRKGEVRIETLEAAENELYKIYVRVLNDNPKYYKCWDAVWAIRRKWNIHHELNDAQKQRAVDTVTQIANKYMGPALQHRPEMKEREDTGDNTGSTTEQQQTLPTINWEASTKKKKKKKAKRKDDPPDTGSIPWMMPRHEELEKQKGPNAASQATEGGSGGSSAHNAYQAVYVDD